MAMKAYSMLNVTPTLDGRKVIGLGDGDDAIVVAQGADVGTGLVGADGTWLFSQTADKSASITIKLKPNSPTHKQLTEKLNAQRAGRIVPFPFDIVDGANNEGGNAPECFVQKAPDDSKGTNAVVREWVLWTGEWTFNVPDL